MKKHANALKKEANEESVKLKQLQDEKRKAAEQSCFLECRAQVIHLNKIAQELEEIKWAKKSTLVNQTFQV